VKLFYEIFNENIGQAGSGIDTTYGVSMVQPKPSA
jgi:hypothetical protein